MSFLILFCQVLTAYNGFVKNFKWQKQEVCDAREKKVVRFKHFYKVLNIKFHELAQSYFTNSLFLVQEYRSSYFKVLPFHGFQFFWLFINMNYVFVCFFFCIIFILLTHLLNLLPKFQKKEVSNKKTKTIGFYHFKESFYFLFFIHFENKIKGEELLCLPLN